MRQRSPATFGAILTVAAVCSVLAEAAATQAGRPALTVMVQNDAGAPRDVVDHARVEVTRLFELIGVGLDWVERVPSTDHRLRVIALTTWEPPEKRLAPSVLGYTQTAPGHRGIRAYVFWRRVERASQTYTADLEKVLAVAIAHEIGHMLLPNSKHDKFGLMRAPWDANHFRSASAGLLTFSSDSASRIRRQAETEQLALGPKTR